jgi:hypothetical protein
LNKLILVCLVVGLIGCGKSQEDIRLEKEAQAKALEQEKLKKIEQEKVAEENKIKELIKKDLLDPESATFKFQDKKDSELFYCGTVNSKNSFGGYVGNKRFFSTGFSYSLDTYQPSDDPVSQYLHLSGFEMTWIKECEGVKPKKEVNLGDCKIYAQSALAASYFYVHRKDVPFNDLKRKIVKNFHNQKYLSEFFDAVRKYNVSYKDQEFPMMYAITQYESCLEGNTSY